MALREGRLILKLFFGYLMARSWLIDFFAKKSLSFPGDEDYYYFCYVFEFLKSL